MQARSLKGIGRYYGEKERPSASFIANVSMAMMGDGHG
jgi:hypothetical protein